MIWLRRNSLTSWCSLLIVCSHWAGVSPAMNSTSVRNVQSWHIARSMSSGSGSIVSHGMSVADDHWRVTASS